MSKKTLATFRVQKRFEIWVETEIKALNFQAASDIGRNMKLEDFVDIPDDTEMNDITELSGFQCGETWA